MLYIVIPLHLEATQTPIKIISKYTRRRATHEMAIKLASKIVTYKPQWHPCNQFKMSDI